MKDAQDERRNPQGAKRKPTKRPVTKNGPQKRKKRLTSETSVDRKPIKPRPTTSVKKKPRRKRPPVQPAPSKGRKLVQVLYNLFFYALVLSIIGGSFLFAFSEKSNASLFGYRFYTVLTNSMKTPKGAKEPGFSAGDIVFVKLMASQDLQVGDVVTFQVGEGERYLTHRLVERLSELNGEAGEYVVTKGDANSTKDPPIEAKRMIGKVDFVVPKAGHLIAFIRENLVLCVVFVSALFGFVLVLSRYFFGEPSPTPPKRSRSDVRRRKKQ